MKSRQSAHILRPTQQSAGLQTLKTLARTSALLEHSARAHRAAQRIGLKNKNEQMVTSGPLNESYRSKIFYSDAHYGNCNKSTTVYIEVEKRTIFKQTTQQTERTNTPKSQDSPLKHSLTLQGLALQALLPNWGGGGLMLTKRPMRPWGHLSEASPEKEKHTGQLMPSRGQYLSKQATNPE